MSEEQPYTTANGVSEGDAVAYHAGAEGAPVARIRSVLRRAERAVRDLTVRPIPDSEDYKGRAADAELAAFEHLFEFRSYVKREKVDDADVTYADAGALAGLVEGILGGYFAPPPPEDTPAASASGHATVHNISPEPLWGNPW